MHFRSCVVFALTVVLRNVRSGSQGSQPFARVGLATEYSLRILLSLQTTSMSHAWHVRSLVFFCFLKTSVDGPLAVQKKRTPERRSVPLGCAEARRWEACPSLPPSWTRSRRKIRNGRVRRSRCPRASQSRINFRPCPLFVPCFILFTLFTR